LDATDPELVDEKSNSMMESLHTSEKQHALLCGLGTSVPQHSISQSDAVQVAQQLGLSKRWEAMLPKLYNKSGVERRGSVLLNQSEGPPLARQSFFESSTVTPRGPSTGSRMQEYERHASSMLIDACRKALQDSQWINDRVTHLITVTCTGFGSPGLDHQLITSLGLRNSVQRTHVGFMGCHAMINAMRLGFAIAESDLNAVVLVGAVELCSLHQQYSDDPQQLVANSLFADGAASVVIAGAQARQANQSEQYQLINTKSHMVEATQDLMSWKIGDHGFEMQLSPTVPSLIEQALKPKVDEWFHGAGGVPKMLWAIHPGGPRILDAVQSAIGLNDVDLEPSRSVLREYGNMSSPTVIFILERLRKQELASRSVCLIGFGPGLHMEMLQLARV
jgi:predicted naringenin-chalcone synthase